MDADNIITRDTPIADVIEKCPNAAEVFKRHGMGCFECLAAAAETVGDGAEMHEIDTDVLVAELNGECKK